MNTKELKCSLFTAVKTESERYLTLSRMPNRAGAVEREIARQRYGVLYDLIERCNLEEEYEAWEWNEDYEEE